MLCEWFVRFWWWIWWQQWSKGTLCCGSWGEGKLKKWQWFQIENSPVGRGTGPIGDKENPPRSELSRVCPKIASEIGPTMVGWGCCSTTGLGWWRRRRTRPRRRRMRRRSGGSAGGCWSSWAIRWAGSSQAVDRGRSAFLTWIDNTLIFIKLGL